jgi:NADH dehydrogenase (ubiquinone) 1 alpha subcomplex subunit 5
MLAAVQRGSQFLQAGAPTGLTGLRTHPSPRGTLLYLYTSTLDTLKKFPEHSVYRRSTEALINQRLAIVEATKPAGLEAWQKRVESVLEKHPEAFRKIGVKNTSEYNIVWKVSAALAGQPGGKDVDEFKGPLLNFDGQLTAAEKAHQGRLLERDQIAERASFPSIEDEPSLTVDQINEIESKIGAGLIEEVIQVAQGEKQLAETLLENQVYVLHRPDSMSETNLRSNRWDELVEKPAENQWRYHARDTHTGKTQAP